MIIKDTVTVEEAISKGRRMLILPRILLISGLFLFCFLVAMLCIAFPNITPSSGSFFFKFAGITIVSFIPFVYLPFLFWSKRTTKWKLWAFDHVDRVHDLKEAAGYAALFASYGTVIDKLQIQSTAERERWAELQSRFNNQYVYSDDPGVPDQTIIYLSVSHFIFILVMNGFVIVMGSCFLYFSLVKPATSRSLGVIGGIIILGVLANMFTMVRRFIRHRPQIILNSKGIETIASGFQSWDEITNEELKQRYVGKGGMHWHLQYNYSGGKEDLDITSLNTNWLKMQKLLRVYRGRYIHSVQF